MFAVPGSPIDPRAEGTNGLIKQGAAVVTEADDVISVLQPILGQAIELPAREPSRDTLGTPGEPESDERQRIVSLLGPLGVEIDELVRQSGASAATVRMVLLELEIAGRIERQAGGRIALR